MGRIIEASDVPLRSEAFDQTVISETQGLIGEIVFGAPEQVSLVFCPSFKRLRTNDTSGVGPSSHLARLIRSDSTPIRSLNYHLDSLFLACRFERDYSQDFLLEYTLSKVYLGGGEYGLESASLSLFNKPVDQLSAIEVFEIAILIKQPSSRDNDEARRKRAHALMERFFARSTKPAKPLRKNTDHP
ncbi:MAG: transglycosylase domain-containing protein [Hellea sp.]